MNQYPKLGCVVSNMTTSIQYVGLTLNTGRVLVHDCSSYSTESVENSFVQFSYLSGAFDSDNKANQTLA